MPTKAGTPEPMQPLMFGYTRVSTDEQADRRNGLEAQAETIGAEATRRGWNVEHFADEGGIRKGNRPEARGSVAAVGFWAGRRSGGCQAGPA
ncbi:recombinase family protein [Mycobacterium kiyosense]